MKATIKLSLTFFFLFSVLCSLYSAAQADIPHLINYQGKLTDSNGKPIEGTKSVTFRIYDAESGGSPLWTETQRVTPTKGIFNVLLGSTNSLNLPFDTDYWLEIKESIHFLVDVDRIPLSISMASLLPKAPVPASHLRVFLPGVF